jgi:hypothetical protein
MIAINNTIRIIGKGEATVTLINGDTMRDKHKSIDQSICTLIIFLPASSTSFDFRLFLQIKKGKIMLPNGIPKKAKTDRFIYLIDNVSNALFC